MARNRNEEKTPAVLQKLPQAARIAGVGIASVLRLLGATWHKEAEGLDRLDALLARGERVLAIFWHGEYLPLFVLMAGRPACIFTSHSFRGETVAEVCRRFGYAGEPLPESGEGRLQAMRRDVVGFQIVALAVDGPLGPYHSVKAGTVRLASALGCSVVPVAAAARHAWILAERWDRMEIPLPFTRLQLVCGEPLSVPGGLSEEALDPWRDVLRDKLMETARRARQIVRVRGLRH